MTFRQRISSLFQSRASLAEVIFDFQDTTLTFVEFFMTTLSSSSTSLQISIILDECQHCDAASWEIIFYMLNHLRAPILFLFTMTQSKQSTFLTDPLSRTPTHYSPRQASVKFLSFDILSNQIKQQRKSLKSAVSVGAANLLVSDLDPLNGDTDSSAGFHCLNQVLDNLKYTNTSHYISIQLTGLSHASQNYSQFLYSTSVFDCYSGEYCGRDL